MVKNLKREETRRNIDGVQRRNDRCDILTEVGDRESLRIGKKKEGDREWHGISLFCGSKGGI